MFRWTPLNRRERIVQWFRRYAPVPLKRCMVCHHWFWNWSFWHWTTWSYGLPEYCSRRCCDAELDEMMGVRSDDAS